MANQQSPLSLSPFSLVPALEDCAGSMHLCCLYARDAAEHGRLGAAHGLFQSAVFLYDRAQQLAATQNEFSFHDTSSHDGILDFLKAARAELDACACIVYPESIISESSEQQRVASRDL